MDKWRYKLAVLLVGCGIVLHAGNAFDRTCIPCHRREQVALRSTFMHALLVYSGHENMKAGLKYFLRHPRRDSAVMEESFFATHPLHPPLSLDDATLDQALEIYWKRYTVQGKLH